MDNLFEILIYLFIIFSFLAPLFRKKGKPDLKKGKQIPDSSHQPEPQMKTPQQEEYDILKEIEKMFKTETSIPETESEVLVEKGEGRFKPADEHLETTDWHQKVSEEHKASASEHSFTDWEVKKRKAEEARKTVNEKIVKQAEMFEKRLAEKKVDASRIKRIIRQRLKNPKSLNEYIIFSEILGKPKALSGPFGQE